MATHLGPHCIEIVLIKPLICGHPFIMAKMCLVPMVAIIEGFHCIFETERGTSAPPLHLHADEVLPRMGNKKYKVTVA